MQNKLEMSLHILRTEEDGKSCRYLTTVKQVNLCFGPTWLQWYPTLLPQSAFRALFRWQDYRRETHPAAILRLMTLTIPQHQAWGKCVRRVFCDDVLLHIHWLLGSNTTYKRLKCSTRRRHVTWGYWKKPMDGGDEDVLGLSVSAYRCIYLQSLSSVPTRLKRL